MKKIVYFLVLIIVVTLLGIVTCIIRKDEEIEKTVVEMNVNEFYLENRTILVRNDELLVGQNIKELENGYYDFKIKNRDNTIIIFFNKLWYEKYGEDYIQDEYLAKICREVVRCIKVNCNKDGLEYQLYKYVKDNYIKVKLGESAEKIELNSMSLEAESKENECVVYVRVE